MEDISPQAIQKFYDHVSVKCSSSCENFDNVATYRYM